jgi:hypothetical protein
MDDKDMLDTTEREDRRKELLPLPVKPVENKLQFEEAVQRLLEENSERKPAGIFY